MRSVMLIRSVLWTSLAAIPILAQRTCYFPNGQPSLSEPCYKDATSSICCTQGSICLTNGLCQTANATRELYSPDFMRAECTDADWKDPACPRICRGPLDRSNSSHGLLLCDASNDQYCCQRTERNCCLDPGSVFKLPPGRPIRVITEPSPTPTASPRPTRNSSRRTTIIVGIAAGLGVALVLMLAIWLWWLLRKRLRSRKQALTDVQAAESKTPPVIDAQVEENRYGRNELDAIEPSGAASKTAEAARLAPKELETINPQVTREELEGEGAVPNRTVSQSATVSPTSSGQPHESTRINIVTPDVIELDGHPGHDVGRTPMLFQSNSSAEKEVVTATSTQSNTADKDHTASFSSSEQSPDLQREENIDKSAVNRLDAQAERHKTGRIAVDSYYDKHGSRASIKVDERLAPLQQDTHG